MANNVVQTAKSSLRKVVTAKLKAIPPTEVVQQCSLASLSFNLPSVLIRARYSRNNSIPCAGASSIQKEQIGLLLFEHARWRSADR